MRSCGIQIAKARQNRNLVDAEDYVVQIFSDKEASACIQAKGEGVNSEVILAASCTSFRVDEDGLIRSFKAGVTFACKLGEERISRTEPR